MIVFDTASDTAPDRPSGAAVAVAHATSPVPRNERVPSGRTLARFLREAQAAVRLKGEVTVLMTSDDNIQRMNKQFRGKNRPTDVLSFPAYEIAADVAGDLAISMETALRQAREQGHALTTEIKILMLHGLLHLAGYDHEVDDGEMARKERQLRAKLGLPQGLIERVQPRLARPRLTGSRLTGQGAAK